MITNVIVLVFFILAPSTKVYSYFKMIGLFYCRELYIDGEPKG